MERALVEFRIKDDSLLGHAKAAIDEFVQNIGTEHVRTFVKKLYPLCVETPNPTFLDAYREVRRS